MIGMNIHIIQYTRGSINDNVLKCTPLSETNWFLLFKQLRCYLPDSRQSSRLRSCFTGEGARPRL